MDFAEALHFLAERAGVTIPTYSRPDTRKDEKERIYQANELATQFFHSLLLNSPAGEKVNKYLTGRGLVPQTIASFKLGLSPDSWEALKQHLLERGYNEDEMLQAGLIIASEQGKTHDRFRNRLMFPIKDARGHIIGFGARALDDSMPKYLNSPQTAVFDKSSNLYGIDAAAPAIRQQQLVVIVEGYMDVIIAHQYGFHNVVASMGTSITEDQMGHLKRLTRNVTLALDPDAAGEEAMLRCLHYENELEAEIKVIVLPEGKDPDEVIKEDPGCWAKLVEQSRPVVDCTFDNLLTGLDLTKARDKQAVVDSLLPVVAGIA
ncbi:MAG: DNA primase, partial [Chloroflexota bacterium]